MNLMRHILTTINMVVKQMDSELTWRNHVNKVWKKMSTAVCGQVQQMEQQLRSCQDSLKYYALVESHLKYGLAAWGGWSACNLIIDLITQKKQLEPSLIYTHKTAAD